MNSENLKVEIFHGEDETRQEKLPKEKYTSTPQEIVLESQAVEREEKLLGGIMGGTCFIKIRNDGGGVFKPHTSLERMQGAEQKNLFISRERAAYLISRFLGFDFVPPTIIKVIDGKEGSFQEFIEDAQIGREVHYEDIEQYEQTKLDIFDDLIVNMDRHDGNFLVKNGKIIAIDHGYTLLLNDLAKEGIDISRVPVDIADRLRKFIESEEQRNILRDLLTELLGQPTADQFMKRVIFFVKSINANYSFDRKKFYRLLQ